MPGAARVGVDLASAGLITGPGSPTVWINNKPASLVGDTVAPHGEPPHTTPVIISGSGTVWINGRPSTVQAISAASCGHAVSTGSTTVFIGP